MAASFGERLLAEVHEERLDELLRDLRGHCDASPDSPSRQRLGVKELDDLLEVFMPSIPASSHQRQALQQTQQGQLATQDAEDQAQPEEHEAGEATGQVIPVPRKRSPDPVVEVSSTSSAAGKSQLLYYVAATAVLPSTYDGLRIGGLDAAIVFIDNDGRFDANRLRNVTREIVRQKLEQAESYPEAGENSPSAEDIETIVITSLQHVHVFSPQSSSTLLATLQTLDTYLFDLPQHLSSNRPLHAILIDSATAFLWQDKLRDEVARTEDIGRPLAEIELERAQKQSFYLVDLYAELAKELKRLQRLFSCAVVFTTIAWAKPTGSSNQKYPSNPFDPYIPSNSKLPSFRSSLPPPWGIFPSLRLVVQRDVVRPFPPTMAPKETLNDVAMRQEMVLKGRFSGWVNGWASEDWPRRVIDGIEERNNGAFAFYVTRRGVNFS